MEFEDDKVLDGSGTPDDLVNSANDDDIADRIQKSREIASQSDAQTQAQTLPPVPESLATTAKPLKICDVSFSCGWGIFTQTPFKRQVNYFMKNSCECPEGEHYVRVSEDTALSAYIYKCRVKRATPAPPTEE